METWMLVIGIITMIANIISCIMAIKAKNEAKNILTKIENNYNSVNNTGMNSGVMANIISGGAHVSK